MKNIKFLLVIFLSGCASSFAPDDWLKDFEDIENEVYGSWVTVVRDSERNLISPNTRGEFIGIRQHEVVILTEERCEVVPFDSIYFAQVEIFDNDKGTVGLWLAGVVLTPLINGKFAFLTWPTWLIVGSIALYQESYAGVIIKQKPDLNWWQQNQKYARFPFRIPEDIVLEKLRTRSSK